MRSWLHALMIPLLVASMAVAAPTPSPSPSASPTPPPDPIKIETFTYQNSQLPNDQVNNLVHGQLVIKNTGHKAIPDLQIIVHIQDGNQKDLDTETQVVKQLKPDESYTYEWNWRNYSGLVIDPLAEVRHPPSEKGADPKKLVVSTSRATSPAGGPPSEGGSVQQPNTGDQTAPGMDPTQTPPPPPPPGY